MERANLEKAFPELMVEAKKLAETTKVAVKSVTLDTDKKSGSVEIEISTNGTLSTDAVNVRREDDSWCVVRGWAEDKRLHGVAEQATAAIAEAERLMNEWKFDEVRTKLSEAQALLGAIPPEHAAGTTARSAVETQTVLLDLRAKDWLGGRWIGKAETDPMTDESSAVSRLESVDGLPNVIGQLEKAHLILRCQRGVLEAFVHAGTTLDSNWRYDTVTGQYRFEGQKAEKLVGSVSSSRDSVFLRNPKEWAKAFKQSDGSKWLVELPLYNRTPQTVTFDLTASAAAVDLVVGACGG